MPSAPLLHVDHRQLVCSLPFLLVQASATDSRCLIANSRRSRGPPGDASAAFAVRVFFAQWLLHGSFCMVILAHFLHVNPLLCCVCPPFPRAGHMLESAYC